MMTNTNMCGKKFASKSDIKNHERIHNNANPFSCTICDKKFRLESYLTKHEGLHKKEKPFSCQECDRKFYKAAKLKSHVKTHNSEKPYRCHEREKSKKTLKVGSLNICKGLNNKEVQLLNMIENEDLDII